MSTRMVRSEKKSRQLFRTMAEMEKLERFVVLEFSFLYIFFLCVRVCVCVELLEQGLDVCAASTARASPTAEALWHDCNLINE